ncbi:MAG: putative glycosyl transferase [Verrucomicrobia bacterium ADurb.Bin006]|nr:MAG: putative glycosyl transferase [Verrucomicrobia bacterium ADurb.Bin006]
MRLLFIGGHYVEQLKPFFRKNARVGLDLAANNLQEAIFKGFEENHFDCDVLSTPYLGSFPPYFKTPFVKGHKSADGKTISIPYLNVSYVKRSDIRRRCLCHIREWCKDTRGKRVVLFYNFSCIALAPRIKEEFPDTKICLLVTDLKKYMAADSFFLTRVNASISSYLMKDNPSTYGFVDGYILLASKMTECLPIASRPWLLMEGIYNPSVQFDAVPKDGNRVVLYTGNLGKRYGICSLLHAFCLIKNENYRLQFCGDGDGLSDISELIKRDNRVSYFGILPRADVLTLQKRATILINPRPSTEAYTKYSFPSKTMEYMASGTPTLMCRLGCLPEEYKNLLYFIEDESAEGIKAAIVNACEKRDEELQMFGKAAADFIMRKKTPKVQASRIIEFIERL